MSTWRAARELWDFMKERKRFWLTPIVILLLVVAAFLVIAQTPALSPFIYTFF